MSITIKGIDLPKEGSVMLELYPNGDIWIDNGSSYEHKYKVAEQLAPGCDECKYDHVPMTDYPCNRCEYCYNSQYEPKDDEGIGF